MGRSDRNIKTILKAIHFGRAEFSAIILATNLASQSVVRPSSWISYMARWIWSINNLLLWFLWRDFNLSVYCRISCGNVFLYFRNVTSSFHTWRKRTEQDHKWCKCSIHKIHVFFYYLCFLRTSVQICQCVNKRIIWKSCNDVCKDILTAYSIGLHYFLCIVI